MKSGELDDGVALRGLTRYIATMTEQFTVELFRFSPHGPGEIEIRPIARAFPASDLAQVKNLAEAWFKLRWSPAGPDEVPLGVRVLDQEGRELHRYEWWDLHAEQTAAAQERRAKERDENRNA